MVKKNSKEYKKECERELNEIINEVDERFADGSFYVTVEGQDAADKALGFTIIVCIIELVVSFILRENPNVDPDFLLFFVMYSIAKAFIFGAIFASINRDASGSSHEWTEDKRKLAAIKIYLQEMDIVKKDDLDEDDDEDDDEDEGHVIM